MKTHTRTNKIFLAIAVASLFTLTNIAHAGPHCGGKYEGKRYSIDRGDSTQYIQKKLNRMSSKLGLSEDQKQQVQTLMQNHRNLIKPLRIEKRGLRKEMRTLDPSSTDYDSKLADIANRKAEIVRQMTIARGNKRQQMSQILTLEQQEKRKEIRAKRMKRRHSS